MRKKLVFVAAMLLAWCVSFQSNAQDYRTALGLRLGSSTGISVKHFIRPGTALEGLFTTRWDGAMITGLYEGVSMAFQEPNLAWYFGGGAHIGFWDSTPHWRDNSDSHSVFGLDLILGMEYTFDEAPLNLAFDWKPAINLIGYQGFWADEFALSIRFAFK